MKKINEEDMKSVLTSLVDGFKNKAIIKFEDILADDKYNNMSEDDLFIFFYEINSLVDVVLHKNDLSEATFLIKNERFICSHFEQWIQKYEGSACSVDKSSAIKRVIKKFLVTGEKISFDYNQEYTYHLPTTYFVNHDRIMDFYDSLCGLFYGNPDKYLHQLTEITKFYVDEKLPKNP